MEKIEATFGANMPAMYELATLPWAVADLHERTLKVRLYEVYIRAGLKFADLRTRENLGTRLLEQLEAALDGRGAEGGAAMASAGAGKAAERPKRRSG